MTGRAVVVLLDVGGRPGLSRPEDPAARLGLPVKAGPEMYQWKSTR